jgi:hypothetical protein
MKQLKAENCELIKYQIENIVIAITNTTNFGINPKVSCIINYCFIILVL